MYNSSITSILPDLNLLESGESFDVASGLVGQYADVLPHDSSVSSIATRGGAMSRRDFLKIAGGVAGSVVLAAATGNVGTSSGWSGPSTAYGQAEPAVDGTEKGKNIGVIEGQPTPYALPGMGGNLCTRLGLIPFSEIRSRMNSDVSFGNELVALLGNIGSEDSLVLNELHKLGLIRNQNAYKMVSDLVAIAKVPTFLGNDINCRILLYSVLSPGAMTLPLVAPHVQRLDPSREPLNMIFRSVDLFPLQRWEWKADQTNPSLINISNAVGIKALIVDCLAKNHVVQDRPFFGDLFEGAEMHIGGYEWKRNRDTGEDEGFFVPKESRIGADGQLQERQRIGQIPLARMVFNQNQN